MRWSDLKPHLRHLTSAEQASVEKAFELGERVHAGQTRKSGEPYFTHPLQVAILLADMGADSDTIVAALLHDAVEDTELTLKDIDKAFGENITALIDGVTKLEFKDLPQSRTLDEQIESLRKMFTLMQKDVRIMVIKLVDRLHNMQTVQFLPKEKQAALAKETLEVYVKVADRLCMQDIRDALERLCLQILEPDTLERLENRARRNESVGKPVAAKMEKSLREAAKKHLAVEAMFERATWERLRMQVESGEANVTGSAAFNIAFVVPSTEDCYRTLGLLHQQWQREIMSFQDFINSPAINGYTGLHTTMILEDGTRVRCKIRTQEMQEYARKGIATHCFDGNPLGVIGYLPWAQRITKLSDDTTEQSSEFWESLKSDILGESIVVHSVDDRTVLLPSDSTALDGAFYCYGEKALHLKTIRVNGVVTPFYQPLKTSVTLEIETDPKVSASSQWLQWAHTGLATAEIRRHLSKQPRSKKMRYGKMRLQEYMTQYKKGFLEEFNAKSIQQSLQNAGYASLEDLFVDISEGRLEADEAYANIFHGGNEGGKFVRKTCVVRYAFPFDSNEIMERMVQVIERHQGHISGMQFRYNRKEGMGFAKVQMHLSPDEQRAIMQELQEAGGSQIRINSRYGRLIGAASITAIIALWGFDPLIARMLIEGFGTSAADMTLIRFWTLSLLSMSVFGWHQWHKSLPEVLLPLNKITLWLSVLCIVITAYTTYYALQFTTPAHYSIPMTIAGLTVAAYAHRQKILSVGLTMGVLILGFLTLIFFTDWPSTGILYTLIAVVAFTCYALISEQYKRSGFIEARAGQYFLVLSLSASVLSLPLLWQSSVMALPVNTLASIAVFAAVFTGLPYYLYYYVMSNKEYDFVLRYSFLIMIATMAGQWLLIGPLQSGVLASGALVVAAALLPKLFERTPTETTSSPLPRSAA